MTIHFYIYILYFRNTDDDEGEELVLNNNRHIIFTMETLLASTKNFDNQNKLGEGGFGPVYKVSWVK